MYVKWFQVRLAFLGFVTLVKEVSLDILKGILLITVEHGYSLFYGHAAGCI